MFIDFTDEQKALREELQTYYANLITPEIHELQKLEEGTGQFGESLLNNWVKMAGLLWVGPKSMEVKAKAL